MRGQAAALSDRRSLFKALSCFYADVQRTIGDHTCTLLWYRTMPPSHLLWDHISMKYVISAGKW